MDDGRRLFKLILSLSAATGLSACASLPALDRPAPAVAPKTLASAQRLAGVAGAFPRDSWWQSLADPGLDRLMAEALAAAPDLRIAAARLAAAEAVAEQAGSALAPDVVLDGQVGGTKQSYNMGIPPQFVPKGLVSTGRVSANFGFNLDIWGRNRDALAAARGDAEAARVDAAQARLLLTTGLASAWIDFAQALTLRDIAAEASRIRAQTLDLTRERMAAGIDSRSDLDLAESRNASATAELAAADQALAVTRNRIAALLGAGPDRGADLPRPVVAARPALPLPDDLAVGLLGRRPDIVSARLRAEAARARVRVARKAFYPNINLSALVGVQSLGLSNLFQRASETANLGPAISLPIFDGGQLAGRYRAANAGYDEAIARYDQTLIQALRETADVIAARHALDIQLAALETAERAANSAAHLARLRYQQGIGNMLQLNAAADAALTAQRAFGEAKARAVTLDITLIRALGGGFRGTTPPKDPTAP